MSDRPTEALHPASPGLHAKPAAQALSCLLSAQVAAVQALSGALPALEAAADVAAQALQGGGRLAYAGAGSSGLMALSDALELAGTFGIPPARTPVLFAGGVQALIHMQGGVEDDLSLAENDVARLSPGRGDAVICVSASGSTPYTLGLCPVPRALARRDPRA